MILKIPIYLSTPRLLLREVNRDDIEAIHALHLLPQTDEHNTLGIPGHINETIAILEGWMTSDDYVFALLLKDTSSFIGLAGFKPGKANYKTAEVWYKLHHETWNNGYATEAVKELIHFGFEDKKLHRIEAGCAVKNIASAEYWKKPVCNTKDEKERCCPYAENGWMGIYMPYWRRIG